MLVFGSLQLVIPLTFCSRYSCCKPPYYGFYKTRPVMVLLLFPTPVQCYSTVKNPCKHGIALIISNSRNRACASQDEDRLCETFEKLRYTAVIECNKTADEMREIFTKLSNGERQKTEKNQEYAISEIDDSIVIVLVSHGGWDESCKSDYICGQDGSRIFISELASKFESTKLLDGKPKIFISSACRGGELSQLKGEEGPEPKLQTTPNLPQMCDFFFSFATILQTKSFRYDDGPRAGSIFIEVLCATLSKLARDNDLVTMVHAVHNELASSSKYLLEYEDVKTKKMQKTRLCAQCVSTLRGCFFFFDN